MFCHFCNPTQFVWNKLQRTLLLALLSAASMIGKLASIFCFWCQWFMCFPLVLCVLPLPLPWLIHLHVTAQVAMCPYRSSRDNWLELVCDVILFVVAVLNIPAPSDGIVLPFPPPCPSHSVFLPLPPITLPLHGHNLSQASVRTFGPLFPGYV